MIHAVWKGGFVPALYVEMISVFYILAALLVFLSYKSFLGGIKYLNYFKSELAKPKPNYTPFATIIAPCKGLDNGLKENLETLLNQNYPQFEVIFVVDNENDTALPVIRALVKQSEPGAVATGVFKSPVATAPGSDSIAKLVFAKQATESSQKVENLSEAVLHASERSEVFVFVDSDVRPSKDWLRHLVAPLKDENIGASTGYRWFISERPTFASEMRSAWNASIASALGPNMRSNFCWGGSTAIRRDIFERLNIREKWRGTLSDDFTVTRTMKAGGLPIYFVPQALTASVENCTFRELLEFTTRQMKITRVYAPKLWLMSFFGSGLFNLVLFVSFAITIFSDRNDMPVFAAIATMTLVTLFSIGKSWLRLKAVNLVLQEYDRHLSRQFFTQTTFWLFTPALFFFNSFAASISRKLAWRGIEYKMISPTDTKVVKTG